MKAIALLTLGLLLPGAIVQTVDDPPQVGERFQSGVDEAWKQAQAGEDPTRACAGVKGTVLGLLRGAAARDALLADSASALDACAVAIPVRYFETRLDAVAAGDERCIGFMTGFMRGVAGMTARIEGLPEPEEEAETQIKEAIRSRVEAVCPGEAAFILR